MLTIVSDPVPDDGSGVWTAIPDFVASDDEQFFYLVHYHQAVPSNAGGCICTLRWTTPTDTVRTFDPGHAGSVHYDSFVAEVKHGTTIEHLIEDHSSTGVGTHDMTVNLQIAALGNW